jgi:DNA-directed RNA polymerase subunit alpha
MYDAKCGELAAHFLNGDSERNTPEFAAGLAQAIQDAAEEWLRINPTLLDKHVDDLGLSTRARNCLICNEITTVGKLVTKTRRELLRMKYTGKVSVNEIVAVLDKAGLALR